MSLCFGDSRQTNRGGTCRRRGSVALYAVVIIASICVVVAHFLLGSVPNPPSSTPASQLESRTDEAISGKTYIRKPDGPPRVDSGLVGPHGKRVTIACNTCHGNWKANAEARIGPKLERFHQHVQGSHGNLACVSCHNSGDGYASIRLADGKSVPFPEVMQLCAQCHGPQFRDYQHGAHGGMTGYWDLSKGSRQRNNCIDCHAPHAPQYPRVQPAQGPNDRFLPTDKGSGHE